MVMGVCLCFVVVMGGLILIVLGLFLKMVYIVVFVLFFVLGGVGIVMFGMVVVMGVCIFGLIDFNKYCYNLFIVVILIGFGMILMLVLIFF